MTSHVPGSVATAVLVVATALVTGCGRGAAPVVTVSPPAADVGRKVMIVAEENHGYQQIIGRPQAPYLNRLAVDYGTAADYDAGYPAHCPSLAAYILMTSGSTAGICDDGEPKVHRLTGDNLFHQVSSSGRQWRDYAEAAPGLCALRSHGRYLVRHVPATYYVDARADCGRWSVPLGTPRAGALHDDTAAGTLPASPSSAPTRAMTCTARPAARPTWSGPGTAGCGPGYRRSWPARTTGRAGSRSS